MWIMISQLRMYTNKKVSLIIYYFCLDLQQAGRTEKPDDPEVGEVEDHCPGAWTPESGSQVETSPDGALHWVG